MVLAPLEVEDRGEDVGDQWEHVELTRCSGEGANRAGLGGAPCVMVARVGGEERQILEATLKRDGFSVVPADDGVAALEKVCAIGPEAIIADLDGRDVDGLVLCQVLRGLCAHARLPVLVLTTASGNPRRAQTLRALDGVRVVQKPVEDAVIVGVLSEMIKVPVAASTAPLARRTAFR